MTHRYHRRDEDGLWNRRTGESDQALADLLAFLETINNAVWFDPDYDDGVVEQDDAGTTRVIAVQSRPIAAFPQYTVAQGSTPLGPVSAVSPSGRRVLSFGGSQYLTGAAGLAAILQGSASYSTSSHASFATGATRMRFGWSLGASSPDNRVVHFVSSGSTNGFQRTANGASTGHAGSVVAGGVGVVHAFSETYNASDYDAWLDGSAETLTNGGANTRAPDTLDEMTWGCQRSAGNYTGFWIGIQSGLVVTPGVVLSAGNRVTLEGLLSVYYGY